MLEGIPLGGGLQWSDPGRLPAESDFRTVGVPPPVTADIWFRSCLNMKGGWKLGGR